MSDDFIPFEDTSEVSESISPALITESATPWMRGLHRTGLSSNPMQNLHCEILHFCQLMSLTSEEMEKREEVLRDIKTIAEEVFPGCTVKPFGSHVSRILTPMSDLDIAVLGVDEGEEDPLYKLGTAIKRADIASYIEVIGAAKIPIVKLDHIRGGVSVDVLCNNDDGLNTAKLMKKFVREYPPLKPLTVVIKVFLAQRKLNETYTGGLGSFVLCVMIISFLQMRQKVSASRRSDMSWNLGSLLLEFLHLYGISFKYADVGISIRDGGSYFLKATRPGWSRPSRPNMLCIENPDYPDVDMGKNSYNMPKVRRAFEHAYQVLLVALGTCSVPGQEATSVLAHVIRADDAQLLDRALISFKKSAVRDRGVKRKETSGDGVYDLEIADGNCSIDVDEDVVESTEGACVDQIVCSGKNKRKKRPQSKKQKKRRIA